jgi:ADP-ribose pyrophosphatase YjhB (NUDIX family)
VLQTIQPQKMIVVKVVIRPDKGNILLAKPDYKKTWQLPGGGVNDRESLEDAVVRETREELHLILARDDLKIKGTIYKQDQEILFVIFDSIKLIPEDTELKVQKMKLLIFNLQSQKWFRVSYLCTMQIFGLRIMLKSSKLFH